MKQSNYTAQYGPGAVFFILHTTLGLYSLMYARTKVFTCYMKKCLVHQHFYEFHAMLPSQHD